MTDQAAQPALGEIGISRILKLLPHRYPFLLIDRMVDMDGEQSGVAIKNITMNEPCFQGHFPEQPVFPGVLIIEAMAQAAGALVLHHFNSAEEAKLVYFMSIDKARFRKPVVPGDQLRIHVKLMQKRPPVWKYTAEALVDGKKVAEAEIGAMLVERKG